MHAKNLITAMPLKSRINCFHLQVFTTHIERWERNTSKSFTFIHLDSFRFHPWYINLFRSEILRNRIFGVFSANPWVQTNVYSSWYIALIMDGSAFYDKKCTNLLPLLFFYRFLFIPGLTAHKLFHKQKAHALLCKVGQMLLCALQYH